MTRPRRKWIWSFLVSTAAWASPSASFAVDKNLLPGSACLAEDGGQQIDMEYPKGWIENAGAGARWIVCPIVRDTVAAPDVSLDLRLYVGGYDSWTCYQYCCPNNGGVCTASDPDSGQAGQLGGYTTLHLGPVDTSTDGHCYARCSLDPGSGVVWYEWQDNGTYYLEDDAKVYGGDWCIGEDSDNDGFTYMGTLWMGGATAQNAICPIMRDNTDTDTGLSSLWVKIYRAGWGGSSCTYYAKNISNTVLDTGLESTSDYPDCDPGEDCTFIWDLTDIDESADPGYSYLTCYLNSGSTTQIDSYRAREN